MIVYSHPDHGLHDPVEPHRFGGVLLPPAETASRATRILTGLEAAGGFEVRQPADVGETDLLLVHEQHYLDFLRSAHSRWREATGAPPEWRGGGLHPSPPGTRWKVTHPRRCSVGRLLE